MNKILLPLLIVWPGIIGGAILGGWTTHALLGTGGHMDMSGVLGVFLGAPAGGALGVLVSYWIGTKMDVHFGSQQTRARAKRLTIATASGAAIGFLGALARLGSLEFLLFAGAWLGAVIGCLSTVIAERRAQKNE